LETPIPAEKTLLVSHVGKRAMDEPPLAESKLL